MPVESPEPGEGDRGTGGMASPRRRPRVVVVNDARAVLDLYSDMLEEVGYDTVLLATEAIETDRIRDASPDAVVLDLDVGLQAEYGIEMAKDLRSDPSYAHTPIVVVTAHEDALDGARQALSDIDVAVLLKPFTTDELTALLRPDV